MERPVIFFSHSSKDSDVVNKIKNRLNSLTQNTLDIFVSSDGQSIPLGRNWVHSIESALKSSKLMFIFITPNSIKSNWIYFEAGFAYSKNIKVIPVGLGIDISILRAPLSLLQGFNITSKDSMNNILSVINSDFQTELNDFFTLDDYISICSEINEIAPFEITKYFDSIEFKQGSKYKNESDEFLKIDNVRIFQDFNNYLKVNKFKFSIDENYKGNEDKCILVNGNQIVLKKDKRLVSGEFVDDTDSHIIETKISTYNLQESFAIFKKLLSLDNNRKFVGIILKANENYSIVTENEKLSAILLDYNEHFKLNESVIGRFDYGDGEISLVTNFSEKKILRIKLLSISCLAKPLILN